MSLRETIEHCHAGMDLASVPIGWMDRCIQYASNPDAMSMVSKTAQETV